MDFEEVAVKPGLIRKTRAFPFQSRGETQIRIIKVYAAFTGTRAANNQNWARIRSSRNTGQALASTAIGDFLDKAANLPHRRPK